MVAALALTVCASAWAHDPDYTAQFNREGCTFTTVGSNPFFPLWPGFVREYEGDGEALVMTVLAETELVDGVLTRVLEERETEDGELVEVSRNFVAQCRETGDVWYFGEDVEDFDNGVVVGNEGAWRAGIDGAAAGVLMPGTPMLGARHFQENAPGVAQDLGEVVSLSETLDLPFGTLGDLLYVVEDSALEPGDISEKWYARGIGMVKDEDLDLVSVTDPPCRPDAHTLCLNDGRFEVKADWTDRDGNEGDGFALLPSDDSGEFWFFQPGNTEVLVKVLDGCNVPGLEAYWVFAAGLTNLEMTIELRDTKTGEAREYDNPPGTPFAPILDTSAFAACP